MHVQPTACRHVFFQSPRAPLEYAVREQGLAGKTLREKRDLAYSRKYFFGFATRSALQPNGNDGPQIREIRKTAKTWLAYLRGARSKDKSTDGKDAGVRNGMYAHVLNNLINKSAALNDSAHRNQSHNILQVTSAYKQSLPPRDLPPPPKSPLRIRRPQSPLSCSGQTHSLKRLSTMRCRRT